MSYLYYNLLITTLTLFGIFVGISQMRNVSVAYFPKIKNDIFDESLLLDRWKNLYISEDKKQEKQVSPDLELKATSVGLRQFALLKINNKSYVVSQGQVIEGVKIQKIERDKIIVSVYNETKTVKLGQKVGNASKPSNNTSTPSVNLPPLESILPSNKIPKSELERLTSDPGIMFTQIRLVPFVENGQTKGFRFDWIQDGSLFQKMGIQVGDVLVAINNQQINSGEDAFRILQIIRNEPNF